MSSTKCQSCNCECAGTTAFVCKQCGRVYCVNCTDKMQQRNTTCKCGCGAFLIETISDKKSVETAETIPDKKNIIPPFKNFHTLIIWQDKGQTLAADDFIGLIRKHVPNYKTISSKYPDGKLGAIQVSSVSTYDWKTTAKQSFGNDILDDNKFVRRKLSIGSADTPAEGVIYVFYELDKTESENIRKVGLFVGGVVLALVLFIVVLTVIERNKRIDMERKAEQYLKEQELKRQSN